MVDYSNIPRDSRRVPLETRVQFKFDRFDGFISEYSANISPGGMFIRTRVPQPPGTVLDFEFRLGDGFELIRGRGEVVWNRLEDEGPARPGGMGLHFLELAEGSRDLIYRIVDQHVALGGTPFDLEQRPREPVPEAPPDLAPPLPTATSWPRPAPPPPLPPPAPPSPINRDVFDLPPVTPAPAPMPEPSSWLPDRGEPGPGVSPLNEPFPDLFAAPEPPPAEAPPMFAPTFGHASVRQPRRVLPLALLTAGLLLAVALFLFRDRLMDWVGLGGEEGTVAQAAPPRRPKTVPPARPAVPAPDSGTSDSALPEASAAPPAAAPGAVAGGAAAGAPAPATPGTPAAAAPPPARPPVAPFPAVPDEDGGPALTAVDRITFEAAGGGTDVILWGNGAIPASVYTRTRLDGNPPRELFRLSGIRQQFAKARLVAGTPEVLQIRTGLHAGAHGSELHVVLDLAHPNVTVTQVESGPHRLRIHLQRK